MCKHDPAKCARERRTLPDGTIRPDGTRPTVDWPTCPVRAAIEDPAAPFVMRLHRDAQVAPIAGWTTRFAAWVPDALEAYSQAVEDAAKGG